MTFFFEKNFSSRSAFGDIEIFSDFFSNFQICSKWPKTSKKIKKFFSHFSLRSAFLGLRNFFGFFVSWFLTKSSIEKNVPHDLKHAKKTICSYHFLVLFFWDFKFLGLRILSDFEHDFLLDHASNRYKNFVGQREVSNEHKSAFLWQFDQNRPFQPQWLTPLNHQIFKKKLFHFF